MTELASGLRPQSFQALQKRFHIFIKTINYSFGLIFVAQMSEYSRLSSKDHSIGDGSHLKTVTIFINSFQFKDFYQSF